MTESYHYIDTCTLVGLCCVPAADAYPIDHACAAVVAQLIADDDAVLATSELTLIEFHDTVATLLRATDRPTYDEAWFEGAIDQVMALIADGVLAVVDAPPKVAEHAMVLVTVASRDHGRKFKAADATHIITAAGWARQIGARVAIVTADSDFDSFLEIASHFKSLVDLHLVTE